MGWWNRNLKNTNTKNIESNLRRVAKLAYFGNTRGNASAHLAHADIHTKVKISYMINPSDVSDVFDNNKHGILRTDGATFLPRVCSSTDLQTIVTRLDENNDNKGALKMYDFIENSELLCDSIDSIMRTLLKEYAKKNFLFQGGEAATVCDRNGMRHDPLKEVRNASTVLAAHQLISSSAITEQHLSRMRVKRAVAKGTMCLAAESFLIRTGMASESREEVFHTTAVNNYFSLNNDLEKLQIMIALCRNNKIKQFIKSLLIEWDVPRNVFETNWYAQFLRTCKDIRLKIPKKKIHRSLDILRLNTHRETDYLVVRLEGLCALSTCITNEFMHCFFEILLRRNQCKKCKGLLMLSNGSMRIDMTSHFINAMTLWIDRVK